VRVRGLHWLIVSLAVAAFGLGDTALARAADPLLWGHPIVIGTSGPNSVSCPTTSLCVAINTTGYVSISPDPGGRASSWTASPSRMNVQAGLYGLSCPSTSLCVAVGGGSGESYVATSTDPAGGAATWKGSALTGGGDQLSAVSCASTSLCVAVGFSGTVATSTDPAGGAGTWTAIQAPTSTPFECGKYGPGEDCQAAFTAVSCPSVSLCASSALSTATHSDTDGHETAVNAA